MGRATCVKAVSGASQVCGRARVPFEPLDLLLRRVLAGAIGAAVVTAGCSDREAAPSICESETPRSLWEAARVSAGLDYLGLRRDEPTTTFDDYAGELCSGATDKAECTTMATSVQGDHEAFSPFGLTIATRGQEVIVMDSHAKAAALLHPELPEVAALFALGFGGGVSESPGALCESATYQRDGNGLLITIEFRTQCLGDSELVQRSTRRVERDGTVTDVSSERIEPPDGCWVTGRLHEGEPLFFESDCDERGLLKRAAYYEWGSVDAFERLARELDAHGAPRTLVDRARAAAGEERVHARITSELARVRGATGLSAPPPSPTHVRALEAIALENAVEGCVRETYAAVLALHQSVRAHASDVRAAMGSIADDEVRHAALAWDVAAWAEAKLHDDARGRVEAARRRACDELATHAHASYDARTRTALGLPDNATAAAMARELARALAARTVAAC